MAGGKHNRTFLIRGFKPLETRFISQGLMEDIPSYVERKVKKQHEAINVMCIDLMSMHGRAIKDPLLATSPADLVITDNRTVPDAPDVVVVDIYVHTTAKDATDLRSYRKDVLYALKLWAEKCRVQNVRGWRVNAIKSPKFERADNGMVVIKTQVILGTTIFYNDRRFTIGYATDAKSQFELDIWQLHKYMREQLDQYYMNITYDHSIHGKGVVEVKMVPMTPTLILPDNTQPGISP
jgi:hypothetical protein